MDANLDTGEPQLFVVGAGGATDVNHQTASSTWSGFGNVELAGGPGDIGFVTV